MDFRQKYTFVDPQPLEGTQSFRARQTASGREVMVHLLTGGKTPENEALLARLRKIPPRLMAKLVEVGEHEGTKFVVTVAPPYQALSDFVRDQEIEGLAETQQISQTGLWNLPANVPPQPERPLQPGSPGEFTQMFQAPPAPAAEPVSGGSKPGEFTQLFSGGTAAQSVGHRLEEPLKPVDAGAEAAKPLAGHSPGAFTRVFHSPLTQVPSDQPAPPAPGRGR